MLVEQLEPGALEALAPVAVGLVRHHDPDHPVGDLLAVHGRLELGLDLGELLGVLAGQAAEEALAGEAPELGRRALER